METNDKIQVHVYDVRIIYFINLFVRGNDLASPI